MTYDAFAKGLLDRFGQVLPERWRPSPELRGNVPERTFAATATILQQWVRALPKSVGSHNDIMTLTVRQFERHYLLRVTLANRRLA